MRPRTLPDWMADPGPIGRYWQALPSIDRVECALCPRHCRTRPGQSGFCGVRGNIGGQLRTFSYGRSVQPAVERIETEAVFHFRPGARILSLGNIGCNMACSFCQNWQTSQIRHLDPSSVRRVTPQGVVDLARRFGIRLLSWTYNDPVVWHEFVVETARLAHRHGIASLYKSACFIEEEPVRELCDVIDVFSISLKSVLADFYTRHCLGRVAAVLRTIRQVHAAGRHLEVSQLVVTGLNDSLEDSLLRTVSWMLDNVGPEVPFHFVRFHPAYRHTSVTRTPIATLLAARDRALEAGIRHCYLGNLYLPGVSDTRCTACANLLVERFGLSTRVVGIDPSGRCTGCGLPTPVAEPFGGQEATPDYPTEAMAGAARETAVSWSEEVNNVHVVRPADGNGVAVVCVRHVPGGEEERLMLGGALERAVVSRTRPEETGIVVRWPAAHDIRVLPLLDRAHYPVSADARG